MEESRLKMINNQVLRREYEDLREVKLRSFRQIPYRSASQLVLLEISMRVT
jgi:hypothetical protein